MERLRCWVDSLLVRLSDLKAGHKVYVPECFDGHLLVRATETVESRQATHESREGLLELHGQSKTPEAFELASLRTYLHGLQSTHLEFLSADVPFKFHGACDVAFSNRAFDPDPRPQAARTTTADDKGWRFRTYEARAEDRVTLVIAILRSLRPTGCAVVALPLSDTYNRQTSGKDSLQEARFLPGFQSETHSLRGVKTPAQLRELLVREGLLRAVIGLPGRVGVLLLIEGAERRGVKDDPQQSQVLFVTRPENWHTIHKLGLQQTPEPKSQSPLEAIVSLVEEERRGKLPASNPSDPGSKFRPFFTWVSRTELEQKKFELKLPTPSQPGSDIPDVLTSADFSDLRARLADLEARRDQVARRMDGALDQVEEDI